MSNCSATASRAERRVEPALIDLAYAKGLPLVATNEPFFATARRLRGARRAALHRRRPADRRHRPPPAHRRAPLQDPRRNGGAVRRSAGSAGIDGRDRRALRVPPADAQADPAALHRRRGERAADASSEDAAELRRAGRGGAGAAGWRGTASRQATPTRTIASGSTSSSTSSTRMKYRRLLPDRRRLHPVGEGARHSGRARAAAPAPARWSPMR